MAELTPRDDDRKMVSEILKRADQLRKSHQYEQALLEVARAKEIDPKNIYVFAIEDRINQLIVEEQINREAELARQQAEKEAKSKRDEENRKFEEQLRKEEDERKLEQERQRLERERKAAEKAEEEKRGQEMPHKEIVTPSKTAKGKSHILVIDDDAKLLEMLTDTLMDFGFEAMGCTTSDEAFRLLKGGYKPDLILSDINLETSTMGGFTFYEKLRQLEHLQDVPFIFLSGLSDEILVRTGKELGVDDYLTKPFSPESLIATVKGKLKRYQQLRKRSNKG